MIFMQIIQNPKQMQIWVHQKLSNGKKKQKDPILLQVNCSIHGLTEQLHWFLCKWFCMLKQNQLCCTSQTDHTTSIANVITDKQVNAMKISSAGMQKIIFTKPISQFCSVFTNFSWFQMLHDLATSCCSNQSVDLWSEMKKQKDSIHLQFNCAIHSSLLGPNNTTAYHSAEMH